MGVGVGAGDKSKHKKKHPARLLLQLTMVGSSLLYKARHFVC